MTQKILNILISSGVHLLHVFESCLFVDKVLLLTQADFEPLIIFLPLPKYRECVDPRGVMSHLSFPF